MRYSVWEKIEWVREQPEHIRMRYVTGCLAVSMVFIIGIWFLSLKESFQNVSRDIPNVAEKSKELLPSGEMPSLGNLLEQAKPLRVDKQDEKTGQAYFEEQFRSQQNPNSEDTAPEPTE
jgi:hypothetical protein